MILLDVNILIYAVNEDAPLLWRARPGHGLFRNPTPVDTAFDLLDAWLEQPVFTIVDPGPRHRSILRGLLSRTGTGGNLTSDAQLAALALEHRAELCSADHDFQRFPGLRWRNPLA